MLVKQTITNSNGKKIKKFSIPKFPSALVIIFFVLLFVIILSWIPHKEWIDKENPFLIFEDELIKGPNQIIWGSFLIQTENLGNNKYAIDTITFSLNLQGANALNMFLIKHNVEAELASQIQLASMESEAFLISNILLNENDWNQVAINYSSLSFTLSFSEKIDELINPSFMNVTIDQIFQIDQIIYDDYGNVISMGFGVTSGSIDTNILNVDQEENFEYIFFASDEVDVWFNFWGLNYFVADQNGRYGLLNIPFIIIAGFFHAITVVLFLLCITAFIQVMLQSGALEAGTSSLVKKLNGKEILLLPILFTLFCIAGTTFGMQEEALGLIPLIIPFLILAGFDTMTGLLVIVVGTTSGIAASVLDPFSIGVMSSSLSLETGASDPITIGTGIIIRIIMFIVFLIAGSIFCTWYGHRAKKGKNFVAEPEMYEENKKWAEQMLGESHAAHTRISKRQSIGLIIFSITFGIMIFSVLPWTTWFENLGTNPNGFWTLISSLFFSKILFGDWYFLQLSLLFLGSAFVLGVVFGMKQKETSLAVFNGMESAIRVSMILILSRAVAIVLSYSGLTTSMIAMMFAGSGQETFSLMGLAWILFPVFAFLAIFIPSTSGLAGITGPLIAPVIWQLASTTENPEEMFEIYATVVMVTYPLAQGTINMFMPTTGIVVAQAEVSKVDFGKAFPILGGTAIATMALGMIIISASIPIMLR